MKKTFILFVLLMLARGSYSIAQEIDSDSRSRTSMSGKDRKDLEKKEKLQKKNEKADAKARKMQYKIQTRDVKKRMKKSRREADRINSNKKEFFLKRWFRKKR